MTSARLDTVLVARGLARSRTQARALLLDGRVTVDGNVVTKPSTPVLETQALAVQAADEESGSAWITQGWVGRGALKLRYAVEQWLPLGLVVAGRRCLDVGASTGGFTQVLLAHGAAHVVALDVGHGQLDPRVAHDPRVTDLPRTNIRRTTVATIGGAVDLVVCDVSFISLEHVLPVLREVCTEGADVVVLVKPQFELGRDRLGHDGVVRSAEQRESVLATVLDTASEHRFAVGGILRSPLVGATGNVEYLLWLHATGAGMMDWGLARDELAARRRALRHEEER
ncbi:MULTISPECIES: TlyA family RNA methyltransferase [unclassified Ornithinimicrobium]|uniref:TlyA family RNA methyltransferase n=1 Tax=unclassified Ornithinimicrobium TaxID=2615080 RepID=UPI00385444C9